MKAKKNSSVFLLSYLEENTDSEHPATFSQVKEIMQENGYAYDYRTIRKEINLLLEAGHDIILQEKTGFPTTFFYDAHEWDKAELKILIDAVSSAQFITTKKSQQLIRKLAGLSGKQNQDDLTPNVFVSEKIKAENNQILYVLERIADAIRMKKKIRFKYYNYNTGKERIYRHGGEVYTLSPYATVWMDDRYYVVGYSEKRQDIIPFRIDRMPTPTISKEDAIPAPKDFRIQDYAEKMTRMYKGKEECVSIRCKAGMIDNVIDKFGKEVQISEVTPEAFTATIPAAVSGTFLSWVFQFAGQIYIIGPENVKKMYEEMLKNATIDLAEQRFSEPDRDSWKL